MEKTPLTHDSEGRVMFMEWESFALLHTYSPNNGWKDSFARRADWDARMKNFLALMRSEGKRVVWCGSLFSQHFCRPVLPDWGSAHFARNCPSPVAFFCSPFVFLVLCWTGDLTHTEFLYSNISGL